MKDAIFTQREYSRLIEALDDAMVTIKSLGKSEPEAAAMLSDFVSNHYFAVWRKMYLEK